MRHSTMSCNNSTNALLTPFWRSHTASSSRSSGVAMTGFGALSHYPFAAQLPPPRTKASLPAMESIK
jgi:hypothetical protein